MEEEQSVFLKTAISLVVDGTDPVLVKQILQATILADKYSGSQLLSRLLMMEGVLSLQRGENPRIITIKLSAMMGEKYFSVFFVGEILKYSDGGKLKNAISQCKRKFIF